MAGSLLSAVRQKIEQILDRVAQDKEMGPEGPRIRMGDWLTAQASMDLNNTLDWLLMDGYLTADERTAMSPGVQTAVEAFMSAIPDEVKSRRMDYWNADPADFLDLEKSDYMFLRTKSGDMWFFGMYSNKYVDEVGDIISEAAHEEYAQWVKDSGFKPAIILNHVPRMEGPFWVKAMARYENRPDLLNVLVESVFAETMIARAERVVVWHGFTFVIGKVLPGREELAEKAAAAGEGRMSHGFIAFYEDDFSESESSVNIIGKYRSFEMSLLVGKQPANRVTQAILLGEKAMPAKLSDDDRDFLSQFFSDTEIASMEERLGGGEQILDAVLDHKDLEDGGEEQLAEEPEVEPAEEPVAEPVVEEPVAEPESEAEVTPLAAPDMFREIVAALNLDQLQGIIKGLTEQVAALNEKVARLDELEAEVKELRKDEDTRVAEMFLPQFNWGGGYEASRATETVMDKTEAEEIPGPEGVEEASDKENPLAFAFYNWLG